jgi:hypothetical protein
MLHNLRIRKKVLHRYTEFTKYSNEKKRNSDSRKERKT